MALDYKALVESAHLYGRVHRQPFLRTTTPVVPTAGFWGDLSVGAGSPRYNAYSGTQFAFTPIVNTQNNGIHTGPVPATGEQKLLTRLGICLSSGTAIPITYQLLDYLGYYPNIDGDDLELQSLDNSEVLPRYTTGEGVRAFLVAATPTLANAQVTVSYTNSAGTSGRSVTFGTLISANLGVLVGCQGSSYAAGSASPMIPLASGDIGMRSVESVQMASGAGGYFHLVLCRPLAETHAREVATWNDLDLVTKQGPPPIIKNGASLNFIYCPSVVAVTAPTFGLLEYVWGQ